MRHCYLVWFTLNLLEFLLLASLGTGSDLGVMKTIWLLANSHLRFPWELEHLYITMITLVLPPPLHFLVTNPSYQGPDSERC